MNPAPEFDFDDSKPRTAVLRYSEHAAWIAAHPDRIVFASHDDHKGNYRIDWKPGPEPKLSVDAP